MKILRLSVLLLALLCAVAAPSPARAQGEVSFDFFYDSLAPYGDWIKVGDYGLCWTPTNVDPDWSPYSDGYFAYTDAGWTWVSYEDFGGIVYHYGRWIHLDNGQWCWSPDYQWAPAWVSWRYNHDYVGWAPLPPEARWQRERGFSVWVDDAYDMGPGRYSFCRTRDFGAPVLRAVLINREENLMLMRGTLNVTNIAYNTDYIGGLPVIFDGGPDFEALDEVSVRPIPTLKLVLEPGFDPARWHDHRGPGGRPVFNAHTMGNQLIVAAPVVTPPRDLSAFTSRVKTVIPAKKVNNGWTAVKNPDQFRQEFRQQLKGVTPESAARPVAAADLKAVPAKADPHAAPVTAERRERAGKGQRPEGVVSQPNNVPPVAPTAGNPVLKPFKSVTEPGQSPKSQNLPGTPLTTNPRGQVSPGPGVSGNNHPRPADTTPQERAAEQAKMRAEEERAAQQKQISGPSDAAKVQAEELHRRQTEQQQQLQQKQQAQQKPQVQPQPEQPRGVDPRKAQEAERERERQQAEAQQHAAQPPRGAQVQPRGTQPPSPATASPQPGAKGHSKDSKDSKDKDKDKNGN